MDNGTKLRTALAIATSLNTALIATDITGFENETANTVYKIASLILNFIVVALVTYYNNDYTEEAIIGTATTRRLKENPDAPVLVDIQEDPEDEEDPEEDDNADEIIDEAAQE